MRFAGEIYIAYHFVFTQPDTFRATSLVIEVVSVN